MLVIGAGEGHGGRQAVLREGARAVEVVLVLFGVVPAADEVLMGTGVLDHGRKALAVEAVLRLLVGDHQPFRRLAHGVQVEGEAVGEHLAHGVDDVDELLVRQPFLRLDGGGGA